MKKEPTRAIDRLPPKRRRFVAAFVACNNAKAAAIEAGYSVRSAEVEGSRLLRNAQVALAVKEAEQSLTVRAHFTQDRVLEELRHLALSNVTDYVVKEGRLQPADGVDPAVMRAVASVEYDTWVEMDGKKPVTHTKVKFKLWDKPGTLKLAGQHVGLFPGKDAKAIEAAAVALMVSEVKKAEERRRLAAVEVGPTVTEAVVVEPNKEKP